MADPTTKKILQDLAKDESLKNKLCVDCGNPNPQWVSLSFASFICLQCAGVHRGFGVHVSFVRSVTMDAWQDDQVRRMKLGGNAPLMEFLRDYPTEGGYMAGMSIHDKYHCWAATQYREKLTATLDGKDWSPSPPSEADGAGGPSPAQGLRKSRASTRTASSALRQDSNSPARVSGDRKTAKEDYFASLGASNAARPEHLAPSQGGRYTGFGSTPEEETVSGPPQADPMATLSRGWSLFAGAVAGASRAVTENVVKPGMERVADPELRAQVGGYVSTAGQRAAAAAGSANAWGRAQFGVDVGESVGAVVDKVKTGVVGDHPRGYEAVGQWDGEEGSALYADGGSVEGAPVEGASGERADWDEWKEF